MEQFEDKTFDEMQLAITKCELRLGQKFNLPEDWDDKTVADLLEEEDFTGQEKVSI